MITLLLLLLLLMLFAIIYISVITVYLIKQSRYLPAIFQINIAIDYSFTAKEKSIILKSLINWQEATHGLIIFHIVNLNSHRIYLNDEDPMASSVINIINMLSTDKEIKDCDEIFNFKILGCAVGSDPCGLVFLVMDRIHDSNTLVAVSGHEIGHLLGLSHSENKHALMYHYITKTLKPTKEDINQLFYLWQRRFG
ncbi:MAG: matrixin family metalloprotease [bacterium]|nr:matrixin family metalloprotease [bacterium]